MWAGITGVIIGILIGGTAAWIWLKSRPSGPDVVANIKRENEIFREEVNEHFIQTADLINQLTDSYKAVFDHLSEGAEKLVEPEVVRERMPQVSNEEVRLKRLGAPMTPAASEDKADGAQESESRHARERRSTGEHDASDEAAAQQDAGDQGDGQAQAGDGEPDRAR